MKTNIIFVLFMVLIMTGCGNQSKHDAHEDDHAHDAPAEAQDDAASTAAHQHGDVKLQLISYSENFELYAEADPFVVGETSNILAHFTNLQDFGALEEGKVKASLVVEGKTTSQKLHKATRKGIFSFNIEAEIAGWGKLIFDIETAGGMYQVVVPNIVVYTDDHDAIHEADELAIHSEDGIVFTKEQSWKIAFATTEAKDEAFGQVIRTSGRIEPSIDELSVVSARTSGIVVLNKLELLEGHEVVKGESLLSISGNTMAENNSELNYREAKNNFEKTKADYERLKALSEDQIVSEKVLLAAENEYKNAAAKYETLKRSFSVSGQEVHSPISGYISHVHISSGQYVEAGDELLRIAQNESLHLTTDIPQKYADLLSHIKDATIRTVHNNRTYTLEELNGEVISYGKSTNEDNYMIPVHLHIKKVDHFIPGIFVEVNLKTETDVNVVTIPTSALLEDQGYFSAYVQLTPELFELRNVQIGETDGIRTEITEGITAGERVVSRGGVLMKLAQVTGTLDAHSGHVH